MQIQSYEPNENLTAAPLVVVDDIFEGRRARRGGPRAPSVGSVDEM